jgi:hypothetical protein
MGVRASHASREEKINGYDLQTVIKKAKIRYTTDFYISMTNISDKPFYHAEGHNIFNDAIMHFTNIAKMEERKKWIEVK